MKKTPKKDNNLYDIEVTEDEKEKICIKIHFVGYGNEFDEWRNFDIDSDQARSKRRSIHAPSLTDTA